MLKDSPLGQTTTYVETYSPQLLFPISRAWARSHIQISTPLPFQGVDIWNGYEISWLDLKGKPQIAVLEFCFPCTSENLVESKSLKLYLNSFNQTRFSSKEDVIKLMEQDLSKAVKAQVKVTPIDPPTTQLAFSNFHGLCLDELDITADIYEIDANLLSVGINAVEEKEVHTNLLKSNCLATGQPDWGSLYIKYWGKEILPEGLLQYIISFRRHAGFHEDCVERIFCDIMEKCQPQKLTVYARYTRRGGLDINPFRSNFETAPKNERMFRQ